MKIIDCGSDNLQELENFINEYNLQVESGLIRPRPTIERFFVKPFKSDPRKGLLFARDKEKILGILKYVVYIQTDDQEYDYLINAYIRRIGLVKYRNENVAMIESIDSFPPRQGTGRLMIDALKERQDIKAIFLISSGGSLGFYEKNGFRRAPTNSYVGNPVMIWETESND